MFFKPLFACAASNKDLSVVNQLCILLALSTHVPNMWTLDADMMSVALMATGKDMKKGGKSAVWDQARLGPTVILLEVIGRLRSARHAQKVN